MTGTDASDAASTEIAIRAGDGAQARASEPARAHDSGTRRVRTFHCPGKQEDSQGGQGVCGEAATCAEAAHCQHKWERSGDSLGDELAERESESWTAWKYDAFKCGCFARRRLGKVARTAATESSARPPWEYATRAQRAARWHREVAVNKLTLES